MISNEEYFFSETDDISISACPKLMDSEDTSTSLWAYYFCFENNSDKKIQIVGKDWNITDNYGNSFHDGTIGFKGEIPELEPGEFFEFTSEIPLSSANAVFYGSCKIVLGDEVRDIKMPTFSLSNNNKKPIVLN